MKNDFQAQFENMRDVISSNISSIQSLVTQSQQLSDIICKLQEAENNPDVKLLAQIRENIDSQLEKLASDTLGLYKAYKGLTDKIFK